MAFYLLLLVLLLGAGESVFATEYIVGDAQGWSTSYGDYSTWAAAKIFNIGDTLVFNYALNHKVDIVSATSYENCDASNALKTYEGGKTTITLTTGGSIYFLCPVSGHCSQGQKLAINVVASSTSPPATTTASPPPPPATTTTSPPPPPNGVDGRFCYTSRWMVWVSLVLTMVTIRFVC